MVKDAKINVRARKPEGIPAIVEFHRAAFPDYPQREQYNERIYRIQLAAFPEGQFLAEAGDRVVGYAASLVVPLDEDVPA